jgi:PhzF family phenazine biosynthesis protein
MRIPLYQVDAFTNRLFRGNPAAICPLKEWLPDETLQAIAAENNLAETAYYIPNGKGYHLRWFTPGVEVDLCGHATLAAAHVILAIRRELAGSRVTFLSKSGELTVDREGDLYALDFPARAPEECAANPQLEDALGAKPKQLLAARDYLCVFDREGDVRALAPNMEKLMTIDRFAVIVTAPGRDCDFVSRFFAPAKGVPEDPVTGSAHCTLIPYWSKRLGRTKLHARQISKRGGELWCEDRGARVKIAGNAVTYLEGEIEVNAPSREEHKEARKTEAAASLRG